MTGSMVNPSASGSMVIYEKDGTRFTTRSFCPERKWLTITTVSVDGKVVSNKGRVIFKHRRDLNLD